MPLGVPVRKMPSPTELGEFLTDLLGKQVTASVLDAELSVDDAASLMCGVLVDEDGNVGGACIADHAGAAYAGAALAMIAKPVADEAITAGELTATLTDNFSEVVNILTGIVNTPIHTHLRMSGVEAGVPDTVRDLLIKAAGRSTYQVEIPDYGTGRVALFAR
jgi:hypothetical protein